jgi:hypothetical protein
MRKKGTEPKSCKLPVYEFQLIGIRSRNVILDR